ncbi:MAG: Ig-like domain-containing protein, partial [Gemmatimonadetes bacterium]|nr:Ig-like domain-containing protein [Gemmatimonadota bacterium]
MIEGLREGEVTITVSGGSASADFSITVNASPPRRINVTPYRSVITALGSTTSLTAQVVAENGSIIADPDVQWASLDPAVASVDAEGAVTSVKVGVAEIEGSIGGLADTAQVIVRQNVASLNLSPASTTLNPGEQVEVTVSAVDANGYEIPDEALPAIDWGNTDSLVARRADDGPVGAGTITVTGLRGGTTEITARADDGEGSASITVDDTTNGNFALLWDLYHAMGGDGWLRKDNWLTSEPIGTWYGVTLDSEGRITALDLFYNYLSGEIWDGIGELAYLERLDFSHNYLLTSSIPNGIFDLAKLQELDLSWSTVFGSINSGIGNLKQLRILDLSFSNLWGPLPSSMGGMDSLESLLLEGVLDLTGNIPASVGDISGLRRLVLTGNREMQGSVPQQLAQLASLEEFSIADTGMCVDFIYQNLGEWIEQVAVANYNECPVSVGPAYLVQSIQAFHDPVPLVANQDALLRVFVIATEESDYGLPRTVASFYQGGVMVHEADIPSQSTIIPTDTIENDLTQSVNAVIPGEVLQPGVELVIEIDPDGDVPNDLGLIRRLPQEGRNVLDVVNLPVFHATILPMLQSGDPDTGLEEETNALTAESENLVLSRQLMGFDEFDIEIDEPLFTSYDPTDDWYEALSALDTYRISEGTGRFYFGTQSWTVLGIVGLAYRPGRAMLSILRNDVIAHEWGHNLSLWHAPCGFPSPPSIDPDYPYWGAAIGSWGYNRETEELVDPDVKDVMSYCDDPWISGYNLKMILDYRIGVDAMEYGRVG